MNAAGQLALGLEPAGSGGHAEYWGAMEDCQQVMRFRRPPPFPGSYTLLGPLGPYARTWPVGCGHTVHTCAHTQTTHMLALACPAAELAVGRPFLLSQPGPSLSSGEDGPGWWSGGGVLSQPYTLAEPGGHQGPRTTIPPTPIIQMGALRPEEAEAHLEWHTTTWVKGFLTSPVHTGLCGFLASAPTPACPSLHQAPDFLLL